MGAFEKLNATIINWIKYYYMSHIVQYRDERSCVFDEQ